MHYLSHKYGIFRILRTGDNPSNAQMSTDLCSTNVDIEITAKVLVVGTLVLFTVIVVGGISLVGTEGGVLCQLKWAGTAQCTQTGDEK